MKLYKDKFYFGMSMLALLTAFVVYYISKAPTVSFWDCGEFIATSYIMGIPHPPGYPMYIILGRFFTMLPIAGEIAVRVNILSVLGGAASVFTAYWLMLRIILGRGYKASGLAKIGLGIGALCGSLIMGFSRTFWANAVEAEVYTLAMFLMLLINYLALLWGQEDRDRRNDKLLVLISYLAWFSLGIHMTTFIIILPALVYMAYIDYRDDGFVRWPIWAVMAFFLLYAIPVQTEIAGLFGLDLSAVELETFIIMFAVILAVVITAVIISRIRKSECFKVWVLALTVLVSAIIGYSSQSYIPIRASQHPSINENDPSTWGRFKGFMERKQYGQESMIHRMFKRRGSWVNQFIAHPRFGLLGMFNSQYADPEAKITLFKSGQDNSGKSIDFSLSMAMIYILIIGLYGVFELARRGPPDGYFILFVTLLCTVGLVLYINFSDGSYNPDIAPLSEVRDRDYFYTPGFMYYAIIIGIGLAYFLEWLGRFAASAVYRKKISIGLFCLSSLLAAGLAAHTLAANFDHNDRRGNYLPYDYAKNILSSCDQDGIIFTNGDNDTFPVWFIQEVERYRTDVRVVNLSLLNTTWYIRQIKERMNVPINLSEEEIDKLRAYRVAYSNQIYRIQDQMLEEIIKGVQADGWRTPLYFAITVPADNRRGLDDNLAMEGMAYRLVGSAEAKRVDAETGLRIFGNPDNFRGVADPSVKKDDNDRRLINNYLVAIFQLADNFYQQGKVDSAMIFAQLGIRLQPENTPWQINAYLAKLYAANGMYEQVDSLAAGSVEGENIYLATSQEFLKAADLDKAELILKLTLARYPSSIAALNNLAAIYHQRGDSGSFDFLITEFRLNNIGDPNILIMVDQVLERLKQAPPIRMKK